MLTPAVLTLMFYPWCVTVVNIFILVSYAVEKLLAQVLW